MIKPSDNTFRWMQAKYVRDIWEERLASMERKARALGMCRHTRNCASLDTDIPCNCGGQSIIDGVIADTPLWDEEPDE